MNMFYTYLNQNYVANYTMFLLFIYKNVAQNICPFALNLNLSDIGYHDR